MKWTQFFLSCMVFGFILALSGCGGGGGDGSADVAVGGASAVVTTLFTAGESDDAQLKDNNDVPLTDIDSFIVTLTQISLMGFEDIENNTKADELVSDEVKVNTEAGTLIFEGSMDVDLIDLQQAMETLGTLEIPAGRYNQARLFIENPRLYLTADPTTEITDVQLTASSRLFATGPFEFTGDETTLILVEFGGIRLLQTGNGKYLLTPQLKMKTGQAVLETIETAMPEAYVMGVIVEVLPNEGIVVVDIDGSAAQAKVYYPDAVIYLPSDTGDTGSGTAVDLQVDTLIDVSGIMAADGVLEATAISVLE